MSTKIKVKELRLRQQLTQEHLARALDEESCEIMKKVIREEYKRKLGL